jgi:hypothetical protein
MKNTPGNASQRCPPGLKTGNFKANAAILDRRNLFRDCFLDRIAMNRNKFRQRSNKQYHLSIKGAPDLALSIFHVRPLIWDV